MYPHSCRSTGLSSLPFGDVHGVPKLLTVVPFYVRDQPKLNACRQSALDSARPSDPELLYLNRPSILFTPRDAIYNDLDTYQNNKTAKIFYLPKLVEHIGKVIKLLYFPPSFEKRCFFPPS
jgi:hypothetical protein